MATIICKPLTGWDGELTPDRERVSAPFGGNLHVTLEKLRFEADHLGGDLVVVEVDVGDSDIRISDGLPRAHAKVLPPVRVSFETVHGARSWATDRYSNWYGNLHGIALTLDRLRAIERYGATRGGQQYAGWKALEAGTGATTRLEAIARLGEMAGISVDPGRADHELVRELVREAKRQTHPDIGGRVDEFREACRLAEIVEGD